MACPICVLFGGGIFAFLATGVRVETGLLELLDSAGSETLVRSSVILNVSMFTDSVHVEQRWTLFQRSGATWNFLFPFLFLNLPLSSCVMLPSLP